MIVVMMTTIISTVMENNMTSTTNTVSPLNNFSPTKNLDGSPRTDVIGAYVADRYITEGELRTSYIYTHTDSLTRRYRLYTDKRLRIEIKQKGEAKAIVSFQATHSGYVAVARLYDYELVAAKQIEAEEEEQTA